MIVADVKAVVLFSAYSWIGENGHAYTADKGDEISVPQAEFDRGESLGGLAKPGSKHARQAVADADAYDVARGYKPDTSAPGLAGDAIRAAQAEDAR